MMMFELHLNNLHSLSVSLLIIAGFDLFFAVIAFGRRKAVGAGSFLLLMLAMSIYAAGYAFELAAADLNTALFFSDIQYFGIPFVAFLLYSLIWKFLRHTNTMPVTMVIPMLIVPVLTFFFHLTCSRHDLFYINPELHFYNGMSVLSFQKGIWKHIDHAYTFCLIIAALIHCVVRFIKDEKYRSNIAVMIGATIFPFGGFLLYIGGLAPDYLDITPLTFGLSFPFLAIAVFHHSLFDIVPVARDHIFENLNNGLLVTDSSHRLIDYNKSILAIFPELGEYRVGVSIKQIELVNNEVQMDLHQRLNISKTFETEINGEKRFYNIQKNVIARTKQFYGGTIYIVADITEEKVLEAKLHFMATTDALTGIKNRRNVLDIGEKEIKHCARYKRELSVVFFDIDHFKKVNDAWGHLAGDKVLIEVTRTCTGQIRDSDSFGRYGGEEFVLILPETSYEAAVHVAEKLRRAIERTTVVFEQHKIHVTASFGVAFLENGDALDDLFSRADQLLYKAKNTGRNQVCWCLDKKSPSCGVAAQRSNPHNL